MNWYQDEIIKKKSPSVSQNWANFAFFLKQKKNKDTESSDRHKKHTYILAKINVSKAGFQDYFRQEGIYKIYTSIRKKEELMLLLWALKNLFFVLTIILIPFERVFVLYWKNSLLLRARIKKQQVSKKTKKKSQNEIKTA